MYDDGADIIRVSFEGGDLFRGIVVVDSNLEVVGSADNPVLPRNKSASSYRYIGEFEGLDNGLQKHQHLRVPRVAEGRTCDSYDQMYTWPECYCQLLK